MGCSHALTDRLVLANRKSIAEVARHKKSNRARIWKPSTTGWNIPASQRDKHLGTDFGRDSPEAEMARSHALQPLSEVLRLASHDKARSAVRAIAITHGC